MSFCWAPQTDCSASFRWASIRWKNLFSGSVGGRWAIGLGSAVVECLPRTLALVVVLAPAAVGPAGCTIGCGGGPEVLDLALTTGWAPAVAGVGAGAVDGGGWMGARAWATTAADSGGGLTGGGGWLAELVPVDAFTLVLTSVGVLLVVGTAAGGTAAGGGGSEVLPAGRVTAGLAVTGGGGALVLTAAEGPGRLASSKLMLPAISGADDRG